MAVYRRSYRPYAGRLTASGTRLLTITRYALLEVVDSRLMQAFFVLCLVPFLIECGLVYVVHNPAAQALLGGVDLSALLKIDAVFFLRCLRIQGFLAFILAAWIGPSLIAPDLTNGALPLYLSRPISRAEYVAGKLAVLFVVLSLVTWVPMLLLFLLQSALAEGWMGDNLRIAGALLLGSLIWIALISLLSLALSAMVRRRVVGTLLMCAVFFVGPPFSVIWEDVIGNAWGQLASLGYVIVIVWNRLFLTLPAVITRNGRVVEALPTWAAWGTLLLVCAFSLWLLNRRVRAREIVR